MSRRKRNKMPSKPKTTKPKAAKAPVVEPAVEAVAEAASDPAIEAVPDTVVGLDDTPVDNPDIPKIAPPTSAAARSGRSPAAAKGVSGSSEQTARAGERNAATPAITARTRSVEG